jgi:hypothetical protein
MPGMQVRVMHGYGTNRLYVGLLLDGDGWRLHSAK